MDIGQLSWEAMLENSDFLKSIKQIEDRLNDVSKQMEKQGDIANSTMNKLSQLAAGYLSLNAAKGFISQMIAVRSELKDTETSFKVFLGSAERASEFMEELSKHAYNSVFEFKDIAAGAASLLSYGAAAESVVPTLDKLSNIAAGTNQPLSEMIALYNKAATSTRLLRMDLEQMQRNGIPIVRQLAESYSKTEEQIWAMASAGQIGFEDMQVAMEGLTSAGGMFFNMMEEKSKNMSDRIGLLQDVITSMFNELGEANEGYIRKGIDSAIYLVEHYNEVIKILKTLTISYGIYRAALIANTLAVSGMSAMELLHYGRLVIAERAQKLLNITTAANPYVAAAAALAILGTAMYTFTDRTASAEKAQAKLNDVMQEAHMATVEQTIKLNDLIRVAKDENRSKSEREKAIKQINDIAPEYLGNLTLEKIGTKESTDAINEYITALKNKAKQEAIYSKRVELEKELISIDAGERDALFDDVIGGGKAFFGGSWTKHLAKTRNQAKKAVKEQLDVLSKAAEEALIEADTTDDEAKIVKNAKYWQSILDDNISQLKGLDSSAADFVARSTPLKKAIKDAQDALKAFEVEKTGGRNSSENKLKKLLEDLQDAERAALQSGLEKQDSEIDRINERYDALEKRAKSLGLNPAVFARIDNARKTETGNQKQKNEINEYKKQIDRQKEIFTDFEEYKTRIGAERAKEMFAAQMGEYNNYIDYLRAELKKLEGDNSIGATLKRNNISESLVKAEYDEEKRQAEIYVKVIEQAETYNQKILKIETDYNKAISKVKGKISDEGLATLTQKKEDEINAIKESELQKLDTYKRSGEEILLYTRNQVKEQMKIMHSLLDIGAVEGDLKTQIENELKGLEVTLKIGIDESNVSNLEKHRAEIIKQIEQRKKLQITTPENEKELQRLIYKLIEIEGEIEEINSTGLKKFFESLKDNKSLIAVSEGLSLASEAAFVLSDALGGVDSEAGYTLDTIGKLTDAAADLGMSIASGNPVKMISAGIKAVGTLVSIGKKVKEMNAAARKEVEDFYEAAIKGEKAYLDAQKERELQIVRNNKTAINGIRDEIALRKKQADADKKEFDETMRKVQGQSYIKDQEYKHGTWFRKAKVTNVMGSLEGKDFKELSSLLSQGRLEGETKALVERLVELEQQGYDASKAMAELAKETSEIFTGTTADKLASPLINRLQNRKLKFKKNLCQL